MPKRVNSRICVMQLSCAFAFPSNITDLLKKIALILTVFCLRKLNPWKRYI